MIEREGGSGRRGARNRFRAVSILLGIASTTACQAPYDVVLENGLVVDGSGGVPFVADVGIAHGRVVAVGELGAVAARERVDVSGLAVAPGFVNMLSWSTESLLQDGRSLSELSQGVTLEVMGEGWSMGPLTEPMREQMIREQTHVHFDVPWTTLAEYLEHLEHRGISCNVASFVGATTVRIHELGFEDRPPTDEELARMVELVREEMRHGAMGVASALIYAPGFYAKTEELIALARAAAEYDGMYVSHMRSEGNRLLEAVDELLRIGRESGARTEIYHLKAAGESNWPKMQEVFERVERARAQGYAVTADMYTYVAGATGLDAAMPPWLQEGGLEAWIARIQDPVSRERALAEMRRDQDDWENLMRAAGSAENVLFSDFRSEALRPLIGRTLASVAAERGKSPEETAMDLVVEDHSRVETVYFLMSEENVEAQLKKPWVSLCSDAASMAPVDPFTRSRPHPRAYGCFARLLGHYVRDRNVISLAEAVRRLSSLPCENLGIHERGRLAEGYHADVVVFDPASIADHATFADPHQLSTGVQHVLVNGNFVIRDGEHTGATPGVFVRGPGWQGRRR